jgi:YD repeat-containing protein
MKLSKLMFAILAVAIMGIGFLSCKPRQAEIKSLARVEYYRSLLFSETGFDVEKGSRSLTPEEAKNINSYKFTYDSLGRLQSVEFVRNDVLLGYSAMEDAAKIVYEYTDGKQVKHFFNKDNQQIKVDGGVYAYEFTLDESGLRSGLKFYDSVGNAIENRNKIHSYTWSKLPDGMIKENRYTLANVETIMSEFCPFYELRFSYNDKGYVTRMANYQGDSLYNCTAENCGDIGVSYFAFETNEFGDVTSFSVHNTVGRLSNLYWGWAKRLNKVDGNGYVVETSIYDQDDEFVSGKMVPITRNVYDEHGALVQFVNMDKDGNVINNPNNGIAYTEYKYDEQGQRIETLDFDKNKVAVTPKPVK